MSNSAESIFFKARELVDPDARAELLREACAGAPELRAKVEAMLAAEEGAEAYFGMTALDDENCATMVIEGGQIVRNPEQEGRVIGPYKLIEKLGEGGFGSVWLADQSRPVKRQVALKILKLGMDSQEVITRFEGERQALAIMEHSNIAKVFDAGTTESGRPYFVMELVRGTPVTQFCNERRLITAARLALFQEICSAVNHAHQKGVIHRDLKPSNILVELVGEKPVPKVIDFGIAKAVESKLTEETIATRIDQFVGTPVYMSPEQATSGGVDIDTRSDIYSLGVLLYELLTGIPPFDSRSLLSAGYDEMRRIIREEDPLKPSSRISSLEGDQRSKLSTRHRLELGKLCRLVHGDLDWIVMKAIEKDRSRRYETANALSADLGRYLAKEPVYATPPSLRYKFGKFAQRNKAAFTVGATIAVALLTTTIVSVWQTALAREAAREAVEARKDASARAEAERTARESSEAVVKYLEQVFQSPAPGQDGPSVTVAETLDKAVRNLDRDLGAQPDVLARMQGTLGETYQRLGMHDRAIPLLEEALNYFNRARGPEYSEVIRTTDVLAKSFLMTERQDEALVLRRNNLKLSREMVGADDPLTIVAMVSLADSLSHSGAHSGALDLLDAADQLSRSQLGAEHSTTVWVMGSKANALLRAGRQDEALELWEKTLPLSREVNGPEHPHALWVSHSLSNTYYGAGRNDRALELLEDSVLLMKKVYGPRHPTTLATLRQIANIFVYSGQTLEALALVEELLPVFREVEGRRHPDTLDLARILATTYFYTGRFEEALQLREENLELSRESFGSDDVRTCRAMADLAHSYLEAGRVEEALPLLSAAQAGDPANEMTAMRLVAFGAWVGETSSHEGICRRMFEQYGKQRNGNAERLAKIASLRPISDPQIREEALHLARQALDQGRLTSGLPWCQMTLGMAEYRNGLYADAECTLAAPVQSLETVKSMPSNLRSVILSTSGFYRAMSLFKLECKEEARALFQKTAARMRPLPVDDRFPLANGSDHDDVISWLAFREAASLLGGEIPGSVLHVLVPPDSQWRWHHPTAEADSTNREMALRSTFADPAYDDSAWAEGRDEPGRTKGFGFGNAWFSGVDIGTAPEAGSAGRVAYFRHRFKTVQPRAHLELWCQRDDGVIVYLDGNEVARDNVAEGPNSHQLRAASPAGDSFEDEAKVHRIPIQGSLAPGEHVLAISLHDCAEGRPDLRIGEITLVETVRDPEALANYYKAAGRPAEALPFLVELVERSPEDTELSLRVAVLQKWLGDEAGYRATCQRMLEMADGNPERAAKLNCLAPIAEPARQAAVLAAAKRACEDGDSESGQWHAWLRMTLGMAHFRCGDYLAADKILLTTQEASSATWFVHLVRATSGLYHAMSRYQQGDESGARKLFFRFEAMMRALPADDSNPLVGGANYNDLILWLAYKEAVDLLGVRGRKFARPVVAVLLPPDSTWRWFHPNDGVDPAEETPEFHYTFFEPDFNDSGWETGQDGEGVAGFGYGEDWFQGVDIGTPAKREWGKCAYFRCRFSTVNPHGNLELHCQRDDGIIVYLDGKEVARDNMRTGAEDFLLPAASAEGSLPVEETAIHRIPIEGELAPGEHVLAISLHNVENPSSDLRIGGITLVAVEAGSSQETAPTPSVVP